MDAPSEQYYNSLRRQYEDPQSLMHRKLELISKEIEDGDTLLDVGCGAGDLIRTVRHKFQFVVGVDVDPHAVHVCRETFHQHEHISVLMCDAENLPFKSSVFGYVTALDILEHLNSPNSTIEEVYRTLKPEGKLIVTTPNWYDKTGINVVLSRRPSMHRNARSSLGWRKLFRKTGFKIKTVRAVSFPVINSEFMAKHLHLFGICVFVVAQK